MTIKDIKESIKDKIAELLKKDSTKLLPVDTEMITALVKSLVELCTITTIF